MLSVLATGTLAADPVERTSAAGKRYATCSLRVPAEGADTMFVSCIVFSESAAATILALGKGDALTVAGRGSLRTWEKDGRERTGLSIICDRALTAYAAGKARKVARAEESVAA